MEERGRLADSIIGEPSPEEEVGRLKQMLEATRRQADEHRDLLRQLRADFSAYKREVEGQRSELLVQARVDLILRLLSTLDEFQRVLAEPADQRSSAEWASRVEAVERALRELVAAEGVERIEALGALYNPWEHEALQHQASPELDDQRVLAVVREGYRMGDRVIRPAQVIVARRSR